jgi:hypothetical protein
VTPKHLNEAHLELVFLNEVAVFPGSLSMDHRQSSTFVSHNGSETGVMLGQCLQLAYQYFGKLLSSSSFAGDQ